MRRIGTDMTSHQFAHHIGPNRERGLSGSRRAPGQQFRQVERLRRRRLRWHRRFERIDDGFDKRRPRNTQRLAQHFPTARGIVNAVAGNAEPACHRGKIDRLQFAAHIPDCREIPSAPI